jgi:hypothetical protein
VCARGDAWQRHDRTMKWTVGFGRFSC